MLRAVCACGPAMLANMCVTVVAVWGTGTLFAQAKHPQDGCASVWL